MRNEKLQQIVDNFSGCAQLQADVRTILSFLEQYNDEYNITGTVSQEALDNMSGSFFGFIKKLASFVGANFGKIKKDIDTVKSAVELCQTLKKYTNGDADANKMIDSACDFIEKLNSRRKKPRRNAIYFPRAVYVQATARNTKKPPSC